MNIQWLPLKYTRVFSTSAKTISECVKADFKKKLKYERLTSWDMMCRAEVGDVRISVLRCGNSVQIAKKKWQMEPEVANEWGKLATCTTLNASFLDGSEERVISQIHCEGSIHHGMYVESMALGEFRGYALNNVNLTSNYTDTSGTLTTNKILYGAAKPFNSVTSYNGDIVEAWREFYKMSEQIPTFLHVEATENFHGGVLIQPLVPPSAIDQDCKETQVKKSRGDRGLDQLTIIKEKYESGFLQSIQSISSTNGLLAYVKEITGDVSLSEDQVLTGSIDFHCRCDKSQYVKALQSLPSDSSEVEEMLATGDNYDMKCHFCNKTHQLLHKDIDAINNTRNQNKIISIS